MKKIIFSTLKYLAFFALGILIFWLLYRKIEWPTLIDAIKGLKYHWLIVSVIFGLLSQFSRALRWKMLMSPMGYRPSTINTFLSVLVLYFINLVVPRAGEVARCAVLSRTDKVPFSKLIGTVFTERLADIAMLLLLAVIIFAMNVGIVSRFFELHPDLLENLSKFLTFRTIFIIISVVIVILSLFLYLKKRFSTSERKGRLGAIKNQIIEGMKSIIHMEKKWLFIGHTVFIFLMWLIMLYVVFLAYGPTEHLTIRTGTVVFLMGGLAMLAPIQGGIGPWHFMVVETLLLYGIAREEGLIFALVAHTTTSLIYIVLGGLALLILVLKYGSKSIHLRA
jgi:glycosyltransferase 2 family protein